MNYLTNSSSIDSSLSRPPPAYSSLSRTINNNYHFDNESYSSSSIERYLSPSERFKKSMNGFNTIGPRYNHQLIESKYLPSRNGGRYIPSIDECVSSISSVSTSRYLPSDLASTYSRYDYNKMNGGREYSSLSRDYDNLTSDFLNKQSYPGTLARNFPSSRASDIPISSAPPSRGFTPIDGINYPNSRDYETHKNYPSASRDFDDNIRDYSSSTNSSDILEIVRELGQAESRIPKDQSLSGFTRNFGTIPRDFRISRESLDRPNQSQTPPSRQSQTPPSLSSSTPPLRQSQPSPLRPFQTSSPLSNSHTPPLRSLHSQTPPGSKPPPSYRDATRNRHSTTMSPNKPRYRTAEEYHYDYRGGYRPHDANTEGDTPVCGGERQPFLSNVEPVRLTPSWEQSTTVPKEEHNFKTVSTFETFEADADPPKDRLSLVFLTLTLHGVGTLMPWNMFITAYPYFVKYKLVDEAGDTTAFANNFLTYVGFASQLPNVLFNWLNVFVQVKGDMTSRIVSSILIECVLFILTVVLAMVDSSDWIEIFFWVTMVSIVLINSANAIFQNTVYGMASKLPSKYCNAVVLGSNISGTYTAIIAIIAKESAPNLRTSAIYYFITALFILLACFDTYFALPLNRFFRYHQVQHERTQKSLTQGIGKTRVPYCHIFSKAFPQLLNVFMIFFVTLAVFPAVLANMCRTEENFFVPKRLYAEITCFLTFNALAMIGNMFAGFCRKPGPKFLCIPVWLRLLFIPAFLLCHYYPVNSTRIMPVLIDSDYAYWVLNMFLGLTSGYFSSLAMMYCPQTVDPEYAHVAGMMGAASLVTGIFAGINFQMVCSWLVTHVSFNIPGMEDNIRYNCTL